MKIYIARHGTTEQNEQDVLKGWTDPPLDALGQKQAVVLADYLKPYPLTAIFSSDMERAADTAAAVARHHGVIVNLTQHLRPIDFGELAGHRYSQIKPQLMELYKAWQKDLTVKVPGGESFAEFQNRTFPFFKQVFNIGGKENILLVTHGKVAAYLCAVVLNGLKPLGGPDLHLQNHIEVNTGNCVRLCDEGRPHIERLNNVEQIEDDASHTGSALVEA